MAFVQPRDSFNHSMFHQTLLSSSLLTFQPSPLRHAPPYPPPSARSSSQAAEKEAGMEAAFKKTAVMLERAQHQQSILSTADVPWAAEPSNFVGEEFSVDELLDFGGFMETEEKGGWGEEGELEEDRCFEADNPNSNSSSPSSALSFEPPPPTEIVLPADDVKIVEELEWLSRMMDDTYSEFPPCSGVPPALKPLTHTEPKTENRQSHAFGTPASSLEGTPCALSMEFSVPVKAKRSKRTRGAGASWSTHGSAPFIELSSSSSSNTSNSSSSCSSSSSSPTCLVYDYYAGVCNADLFLVEGNPRLPKELKQKKKRGRKPKQPQLTAAGGGSGGGERRCSHCGVQKTPQWRAGPMGAKTLCNACGVRYKSGRLLPEYRPACSPTFISHVHSNSHRKVLEMRRKKEEQQPLPAAVVSTV